MVTIPTQPKPIIEPPPKLPVVKITFDPVYAKPQSTITPTSTEPEDKRERDEDVNVYVKPAQSIPVTPPPVVVSQREIIYGEKEF